MAYSGFGKDSGPSTQPRAQTPFGHFPRAPSSSPPRSISPSNGPPLNWSAVESTPFKEQGVLTYQRPPAILPQVTSSNSRNGTPTKATEVQQMRRSSSPYSPSLLEVSNNSRGVMEKAQSPSLVYQRNQYVGGQHSQTEKVQQHPISPLVWGSHSKPSSYNTAPPAQKGISSILTKEGTYKTGPMVQTNQSGVPLPKRTRSPTYPSASGVSPEITFFHPHVHKRSLIDYRDLDAPEAIPSPSLAFEGSFPSRDTSPSSVGIERPFTSSPMWANQSKSSSNNTTALVQEDLSSVSAARGTYQPGSTLLAKKADVPLPKRTRSSPLTSTGEGFAQNPAIALDDQRRAPDLQSLSSTSGQINRAEVAVDNQMHVPAFKKTKIPLPSSSDQVFQENLGTEGERELHAKAKRLARFKDELSEPLNSDSTIKNQKVPARRQNQSLPEKQKFSEDPAVDVMGDFTGCNVISDNEGVVSSSCIVGLCPDMCPESERAERERKGDLDLYERLDGERNLSNEFLAVKKYNRTAEREAKLIRPLPILQMTMDYLLNLLGQPYDDRFLGLYNFLWDRMRAIRMDLRMQHIFNLEAIKMLEQMIRLHIIAMHELCEYTKGEGFSEGFDAHLNIEQMNKTSVELFQLYDDHRKKGIDVPSEREFRGYYALLKLDKHPGYKVEPAELSLDLAKMTPEMRQTREVLFARDVARACRTGNFISFFRLAYKASYLQACLIHAHFSKLRTQALASLHSGLQINQGIPIAHVAKWLGVEGEDIGDLLEYHGFSVKDFEEPYMVKENAFINVDNDFPVKRSKLVDRKRSGAIASDVSFPSLTELYATEEVPELQLKKDTKPTISRTLSSFAPVSTSQCHDEEMCDLSTISSLSPKGGMQKPMYETSIDLTVPDENRAGPEVQVAPASSFGLNFSSFSAENHHDSIESAQKPKYEIAFRNSLGRSIKHDLQTTSPITPDTAEEIRYPAVPHDCFVTPIIHQPMFPEQLEDEEQAGIIEEDKSDEVTTSYCDKEVAESKLKLILRIWKRRSVKKKELREHKQLAANTAMKLLSLGPPIWQHEVQSSSYGMFNIDLVMSERHEIEGRSWSVVNPSEVVAAKLVEKNPDAKCLCWKIVVCPLKETLHGDSTGLQNPSAASSWFHSKLMPANNDDDGNLLVSSSGLAIWRTWVPSLSDLDLTCCLSIIKTAAFDDLNEAITGANGVLFILSEYVPLELQKEQLHDLLISLPSGSHLPLLILSGSVEDGSDAFSLAKDLGLHNIDRSVIVKYNIIFLKDEDKRKLDGFFSDQHLREGLEWLASESPPQIVVSEIKTRELVLSHLNSTLEVLDEKINHRIGPNNCISAFNEALDRSMKEVAAAVDANPTGWPCPEIELLEQPSDESRTAACYLPSTGWSSASRAELLMHSLNDAMVPSLEDDLSWLSIGLSINDDIEIQKSRLENCLVNYLTETSQMMGVALAKREAGIVLQMCTRLELHNNSYYIIPKWVSIFRRIFNWRLMNFSSGEVSSTFVLEQHYPSAPSSKVLDRAVTFLSPYLAHPSFDELVEVGWHSLGLGSNHMEYAAFRPWSPVASSDATDIAASKDNVISMENEEKSAEDGILTSYDHSTAEENNGGVQPKCATKATEEADKLGELLEKCNIMQNLIDKKLAIYF